jgi:phosphatidate cytidylyltransferase
VKEFLIRSASAVVFGVLILGSLAWGKLPFAVVMLSANILSLWEFYQITGNRKVQTHQVLGMLTGCFLMVLCILYVTGMVRMDFLFDKTLLVMIAALLILPVFILFIGELFSRSETPLYNVAVGICGVLYISLPLTLLIMINDQSNGRLFVLAIFALIWVNDTMAYVSGKLTGKHPLYPRISPKKTWEGSIGGALFCIFVSFLFSRFSSELGLLQWFAFGLIIVIFATLGDLSESMIKRSLHIKDTGTIMPGHGGILDRFDATLMTAPFIFIYLLIVK